MRTGSPIYPNRVWHAGTNRTGNRGNNKLNKSYCSLSTFCVLSVLYTHYCLVGIIPTLCKKKLKHRSEATCLPKMTRLMS